ncbi:glycosyltransferase family 2 protein [Winogradskyella forsetii]|uniref:glycosyltransferase family 2 protein n=1 Tax=Winogradskyella forsetii TaxID=2686077 RepID=UPI0015BA89C4|nr:glycosyltransferase [Winogradskyella forsetii]
MQNQLAIIIPYYKRTFFEDTLLSLENQTDKRFTVYIGNDASPEDCEDLVLKYGDAIDIQYFRFDSNLGGTNLVAQWNRCLAMVKAESWIQILGDDDIVSDNFVAAFYKSLQSIETNNCDVIRISTYVIGAEGKRTSKQYTHPELETAAAFFERKFSKKTRSSLSEHIFRKSVVDRIGFRQFSSAWHTDDMALFEFSNAKPVFSINEAYASIRVSEINISGNAQHHVSKNEATFQFMTSIFNTYSDRFSIAQKKLLLKKLEMAYYNIPSVGYWFQVVKLNFKELGLSAGFNFIYRNFKNRSARVLKKLYLF